MERASWQGKKRQERQQKREEELSAGDSVSVNSERSDVLEGPRPVSKEPALEKGKYVDVSA
jgi:hypothetical protein